MFRISSIWVLISSISGNCDGCCIIYLCFVFSLDRTTMRLSFFWFLNQSRNLLIVSELVRIMLLFFLCPMNGILIISFLLLRCNLFTFTTFSYHWWILNLDRDENKFNSAFILSPAYVNFSDDDLATNPELDTILVFFYLWTFNLWEIMIVKYWFLARSIGLL